jgi:hypothetical protein
VKRATRVQPAIVQYNDFRLLSSVEQSALILVTFGDDTLFFAKAERFSLGYNVGHLW